MNLIRRFFTRLRFSRTIKSNETVNVVDSMVKARKLYKELSIAAHPDKHPSQRVIAEDIMQRVTENKHNYSMLVALKAELEEKLS